MTTNDNQANSKLFGMGISLNQAILIGGIAIGLVVWLSYHFVTKDKNTNTKPGDVSASVRCIDIETNDRFQYSMPRDFAGWPVKSPTTGKLSGYPVEICFSSDECRKNKGTWVVLNSYLGKDEPSFCPVCKSLVVGHNPLPVGFRLDSVGNLIEDSNSSGEADRESREVPSATTHPTNPSPVNTEPTSTQPSASP